MATVRFKQACLLLCLLALAVFCTRTYPRPCTGRCRFLFAVISCALPRICIPAVGLYEDAKAVRLVGVVGLARSHSELTSAGCAEIYIAAREFRRRVHDGCSKLSDSCALVCVQHYRLHCRPQQAGLTEHVEWHASTPIRCLHAETYRIKKQ